MRAVDDISERSPSASKATTFSELPYKGIVGKERDTLVRDRYCFDRGIFPGW